MTRSPGATVTRFTVLVTFGKVLRTSSRALTAGAVNPWLFPTALSGIVLVQSAATADAVFEVIGTLMTQRPPAPMVAGMVLPSRKPRLPAPAIRSGAVQPTEVPPMTGAPLLSICGGQRPVAVSSSSVTPVKSALLSLKMVMVALAA